MKDQAIYKYCKETYRIKADISEEKEIRWFLLVDYPFKKDDGKEERKVYCDIINDKLISELLNRVWKNREGENKERISRIFAFVDSKLENISDQIFNDLEKK